jgi:hypothetical protein
MTRRKPAAERRSNKPRVSKRFAPISTPIPRRPRGRPAKTFRDDPDRYVLAVATAFGSMGTSRRGALEIAVACVQGIPVEPNFKPGWGRGINLLDVKYEMRGATAATISGRAERMRRKIKAALNDPEAARWLTAMSTAWLIALEGPPRAERLVLELADKVGEREFATTVLLPLLMLPKKHINRGKTSGLAQRITSR